MKDFYGELKKQHNNLVDIYKFIFATHLKQLRTEKELSQKEIAKLIGCAVSTYANWEQGRREPSIYDIYRLMQILKVDANELFDIDNIDYKYAP